MNPTELRMGCLPAWICVRLLSLIAVSYAGQNTMEGCAFLRKVPHETVDSFIMFHWFLGYNMWSACGSWVLSTGAPNKKKRKRDGLQMWWSSDQLDILGIGKIPPKIGPFSGGYWRGMQTFHHQPFFFASRSPWTEDASKWQKDRRNHPKYLPHFGPHFKTVLLGRIHSVLRKSHKSPQHITYLILESYQKMLSNTYPILYQESQ